MRSVTRVTIATGMLGLAWAGMAAAAPPDTPVMDVQITPSAISEAANSGDIAVALSIPGVDVPAGTRLLSLGTATPGAGRPQPVADVIARDDFGLLVLKRSGETWSAARAVKGTLAVRYHLPLENVPAVAGGPPINLRIDGDGFSGQGQGLVMTPEIEGQYRIAIRWKLAAMGKAAEGVTSYGDGNVTLPAGSLKRLKDMVFMAGGHVQRATHGVFSAVWTGAPPFDPRPPMAWTARLHKWMSVFWGDTTEPPYRVFARYNPMNAGGGAAFPHSFIFTYGTGITGDSVKSILGHEMTHTWTSNDIGKWYTEGDAVYYQTLLAWRAGLSSPDTYLEDLNRTASRYYTNPMKSLPEAEVAPRFWEDTRIRVLPYDRGAMYFAVLDGKIRRASGGKRSVDDLVKEMVRRDRAGEPTTQAVWFELLRHEIGEDGPATTNAMLAGGLMLPESGDFGPCFRRVVRKIRQFDLGFDARSIVAPVKIVSGIRADSEAYKAGLRDGDVLHYGVAMDAVQGDVTHTLSFQVTRGGKTFPLVYLPRGDAVDAYQWERVPGVSADACRF